MTESRSTLGNRTLLTALALGGLGDALLRATPWGINIGLWTLMFLIGLTAVTGSRSTVGRADRLLLSVALLFFAGGFAWRDSAVLRGLDAFGLVATAGLLGWHNRGGNLYRTGLMRCFGGVGQAAGHAVIGLPQLVARDIEWSGPGKVAILRQTPAVLAGLVLSVPLVVLFGGLFLAADAAYRRLVSDFVQLDLAAWMPHLAMFGTVTWCTGGYLRSVALWDGAPAVLAGQRRFAGLGNVETCTVLAALNLLFLSFVIVQFRYLFGGAALVEATLGVTFAEYAREGFFQLVTVACLVLPLLLLFDWLRNPDSSPTRFRFLALAMIGLLGVIMGSAIYRMRLYQLEFGLTELRFHTTAFMLWLAVVLVWFALTVLRGKRNRFVGGALTAGLVVVIGLHVINPDGFIVRSNAAHAAESERPFDWVYAASLSADALPALVAVLPQLPAESRAGLEELLAHKGQIESGSRWGSWNWSRVKGSEILARNRKD